MKTNHQRNYKDTRDPRYVFRSYFVFSQTVTTSNDKSISAWVNCGDHTNGKRGIAKDRKGAKKFINSRVRFHENQHLRKVLQNDF